MVAAAGVEVVVLVVVVGGAVVAGLVLEPFVGVVGAFGAASDFIFLATAAETLSFLSSASRNRSKV